MIDPKQIAKAYAPQLRFRPSEITRLQNRIVEDFNNCLSDHQRRMQRFQRYYMKWRGRTEMPFAGEEAAPNYRVPVIQWQVFSKWAEELAALFGEDAAIYAEPVGPSDYNLARKVSLYETWRVFQSMKLTNRAAIFIFRKILFGRSHAYSPWERRTYPVPLKNGKLGEDVDYEGPGFEPMWPDDLVVPAESDAHSVQDFSYVFRKFRITPNQLLRGEDAGLYQGIGDNFDDIVNFALDREQRGMDSSDLVQQEKDLAEGVTYDGNLSSGEVLQAWQWMGHWRKLKGGRNARAENLRYRDRYESDLLVTYLPQLQLTVGIQDLAQMYPRTPDRRPIVESALVRDGSYWCPSFGEMLEAAEEELSSTHNLATEAGEFSVGPVIIFKPSTGFDPDTFEYQPKSALASDDPAGVRVIETRANLEWPLMATQAILGYAERVTGRTDQNLGRAVDRPNAPRTARQTVALLEQGDVRGALDTEVLKQDLAGIISHFWDLENMYAPDSVFFRVTEEDASGAFDVKKGGAFMTGLERGGRYDFSLKFATGPLAKESRKQEQLALYQLDLTNPLIASNPRALWLVTNKLHAAMNDKLFMDVVPEPPDPGTPVNPKQEWSLMLAGEEVHVHPMDNDQLHLGDHYRRLQDAAQEKEPDKDALREMIQHVREHLGQIQQKRLMQALTNQLVTQLQQNTQTGSGVQPPGQPVGIGHLQQFLGEFGGNNPGMAAPGAPAPGGGPALPAPGAPIGQP